MFYKGIIIDLDNTIYNYDELREKSLRESLKLLETETNQLSDLLKIYENISKIHKYEITLHFEIKCCFLNNFYND